MIILILSVLGLALGSFVNALVWRLKQREAGKNFSILKGRSLCPNCGHYLSPADLVPVFSWIFLGGKCRYCKKPISIQYPLIELATAVLFVLSYIFWPFLVHNSSFMILFPLWLAILTGLIALFVYDLRWMFLPDKIVFPLIFLSMIYWLFNLVSSGSKEQFIVQTVLSLFVASGLFYLVFQLSKGKWIGGGDVKLGVVFGLMLADPIKSSFVLFIASAAGSLLVLPSLLLKRTNLRQKIAFGPLLIIGFIIVFLFGEKLIGQYLDLVFIL